MYKKYIYTISTILHCGYVAGCNTPSSDKLHLTIMANSTSVGAVAIYSCDDGYILEGESMIICQEDRQWSDVAVECLSGDIALIVMSYLIFFNLVDCGEPPVWHRGLTVQYHSTGLGSVAEYACKDNNNELVGEAHIVCQTNGEWSRENNNLYCSGTDKHKLLCS